VSILERILGFLDPGADSPDRELGGWRDDVRAASVSSGYPHQRHRRETRARLLELFFRVPAIEILDW
jgi:hypothetical protein